MQRDLTDNVSAESSHVNLLELLVLGHLFAELL